MYVYTLYKCTILCNLLLLSRSTAGVGMVVLFCVSIQWLILMVSLMVIYFVYVYSGLYWWLYSLCTYTVGYIGGYIVCVRIQWLYWWLYSLCTYTVGYIDGYIVCVRVQWVILVVL